MPVVDTFFDFTAYVVLGIIEFTNSLAEAAHQLRNLSTAK